jgi:DNA-binding transcriptional ArsR family regulator
VSDIVEQVGSSQTNVSRHLNLMYGRGVLKRRRDGATVYYSISDPNVITLCRTACVHIAGQQEEHPVTSKTLKRFMSAAK